TQGHGHGPEFIIAWEVVKQGVVKPLQVFAPGKHQGDDRYGQKDISILSGRINNSHHEENNHDCSAIDGATGTRLISPVGRGASYKIIDFGRLYTVLPQCLFGG